MKFSLQTKIAATLAACALGWTSTAGAQVVVAPQPQPQPPPSVVVQQPAPPPPQQPNVVVQTPPPAQPPPPNVVVQTPPAQQNTQPTIIENQPPPSNNSPTVIQNGGPTSTETVETHHHFVPDRRMMWSGIVTLGISYGVGLVVAGSSAHAGDAGLYVPVFGPWIDLADRGSCSGSCNDEGANRAGLVIDGLFQALGAGLILSAFLLPEEPTTTVVTAKAEPPKPIKPEVHFGPTSLGRGAPGMALTGTF